MDKEILQLKPFVIYSQDVKAQNPLIAYYLKFYAHQKAQVLYKKYQQQGKETELIETIMNEWNGELQLEKQQLGQQLSNKEQNKQDIINYTLKIFARCDNEERNDTYTQQTYKDFQMVSRFLEMLAIFGVLDQDINQKRIYAKSKAIEVKKKLDNPAQYPRQAKIEQSQKPAQPNQINQTNQNAQVNKNIQQNIQSVFKVAPKAINQNNVAQIAKNYQENNEDFQPRKNGNIQFPNPYINMTIGFNINPQQAQSQLQELCNKAISELDFNQYNNAQEALKLALKIIENTKQ